MANLRSVTSVLLTAFRGRLSKKYPALPRFDFGRSQFAQDGIIIVIIIGCMLGKVWTGLGAASSSSLFIKGAIMLLAKTVPPP